MRQHFHKELQKIKKQILTLGAMIENNVKDIKAAIATFDPEIAAAIIKSDHLIDEMEVEMEEECLKVLVLHQPVANDLRFLIAVIKINAELERIGDQMSNIARRIQTIAKQKQCDFVFDYAVMIEKAEHMLKLSLDALVNMDFAMAAQVLKLDDEVDDIRAEAYQMIRDALIEQPDHADYLLNLLFVSRHIERMADHSTNIAEDVIYMIEGEIIRHGAASK